MKMAIHLLQSPPDCQVTKLEIPVKNNPIKISGQNVFNEDAEDSTAFSETVYFG